MSPPPPVPRRDEPSRAPLVVVFLAVVVAAVSVALVLRAKCPPEPVPAAKALPEAKVGAVADAPAPPATPPKASP